VGAGTRPGLVGGCLVIMQQFLPKQKAFLEGELAVMRMGMQVAGVEGRYGRLRIFE
jgi:hypothetical protein